MTKDEILLLSKLHSEQGKAQKALNAVADHMGKIVTGGILVPQERWDQLFGAHKHAREAMEKIGADLEVAAREAGLSF